jgi:hypothetical protein
MYTANVRKGVACNIISREVCVRVIHHSRFLSLTKVLFADLGEIVRKGDIEDAIIHIISGHAEEISEDNRLLRNIEPGDLLGIESLLSIGTLGCSATVIARGSVNVRVYTGIAQKFRERPDLAPIVWRNIVKMLAIRNARDLLSLTAWQPRTEVDHENQV